MRRFAAVHVVVLVAVAAAMVVVQTTPAVWMHLAGTVDDAVPAVVSGKANRGTATMGDHRPPKPRDLLLMAVTLAAATVVTARRPRRPWAARRGEAPPVGRLTGPSPSFLRAPPAGLA